MKRVNLAAEKLRRYFASIFPTTLARNPSLSRHPDDDRWRCALIDVRNLISEMRQREEEPGKCMRPPVARLERKETFLQGVPEQMRFQSNQFFLIKFCDTNFFNKLF